MTDLEQSIRDAAQRWLDEGVAPTWIDEHHDDYESVGLFVHDPFRKDATWASFFVPGAFPGHMRMVRLIQKECAYEEPAGVCHCGTEMDQHTGYEGHGATDIGHDISVRYLERSDTGDIVAFHIVVDQRPTPWIFIGDDPICGGARGEFHDGCGKADCTWNRRRYLVAPDDPLWQEFRDAQRRGWD